MRGGGWDRLAQLIATIEQQKSVYDVVIVGAGLAGLMAAYDLKEFNLLILEKETQAGGRVLTHSREGISYDLGAVLGYNPQFLPFKFETAGLIEESNRVGLFHDEQVHYGTDILECVAGLELTGPEQTELNNFVDSKIGNRQSKIGNLKSERVYQAFNAFFQAIHPGEMAEYLPQRKQEALQRYATTHYIAGNGEMVEQFVKRLDKKLRLNTEVISIVEEDERVRVVFQQGDRRDSVFAKTVIVTSPAPVVLQLLEATAINKHSHDFLTSVEYGAGTVVALAFHQPEFVEFSYIVTPDLPINTVLKQHTTNSDIQLLLIYYVGSKATNIQHLSDEQIFQQTLESLRQLQIGPISEKSIAFSEVYHWPVMGPIISERSYAAVTHNLKTVLQVSQRLFLAGDYLYVDPANVFPYGMGPALLSGRNTARLVKQFLKHEDFKSQRLVKAYLYEMDSTQPVFKGSKEECNIAYYGLILQAKPDEELKSYLLHHAKDYLWEWEIGFGVTTLDSTLVIEGLMESGVSSEVLKSSLKRLVELFYSKDDGAFRAVQIGTGRAVYWHDLCIDSTGHVGYLLYRLAPNDYEIEFESCAKYLQTTQHQTGYWQGKFFPSIMVTTYYAVRLLCHIGSEYRENINRAKDYILAKQKKNGSWTNSVIETSAAILALRAIGEPVPVQAREWLLSHKQTNGWTGEPVLYYWYELDDKKLFYHCTDKGQVTTAWATLALKNG